MPGGVSDTNHWVDRTTRETRIVITIERPALLAELVERLDAAGASGPDAVGAALQPFLGRPGLLTPEQEAGDPDRFRTHLLHVPDDGAYSLVAAGWRARQRTPGPYPGGSGVV